MKTNFRRLVALALMTVALGGAALAQDYFSHQVRAAIPFNFYAGNNKIMPAGTYTFAISSGNHMVAIEPQTKGSGSLLLGHPDDGSKSGIAQLTFRTNGNGAYALLKVEGPGYALSFPASKVLSNLAEASPTDATQTVVIAALR